MKVYLVSTGEYTDVFASAVFTTEEAAQAYASRPDVDTNSIQVFILDNPESPQNGDYIDEAEATAR